MRTISDGLPAATMLGKELTPWFSHMDELIAQDAHIIAFRGAGTVNGIHPEVLPVLVDEVCERIGGLAIDSQVAVLFSGDRGNPERPDVGLVVGNAYERLHGIDAISWIAVQSESWYKPEASGKALLSPNRLAYQTYIFDKSLPGKHGALTQAAQLVAYDRYQQFSTGPIGPIAEGQFQDLADKVAVYRTAGGDPLPLAIFKTPNNPAIDAVLQKEVASGKASALAKLTQRQRQPYGAFFTADGEFALDPAKYPGIAFEVVDLVET